MQTNSAKISVQPSRYEQVGPLLLAGLREPLTENAEVELPQLWQRFLASMEKIPHRSDASCYGLCVQNGEAVNDYYYMAACAVSEFTELPTEFSPIIIPSQHYAVFNHYGYLSDMRKTISAAFDDWLPNSQWRLAKQPSHSLHFFEKYTEEFDIEKAGGIEIWLPVSKP